MKCTDTGHYAPNLAMRLFREDLGVQADPERYPAIWREYLTKAEEILGLQKEDDDA